MVCGKIFGECWWNEKKVVTLHADYIQSNSRGCRQRPLAWARGATDGYIN
jgi:hypothetical protein